MLQIEDLESLIVNNPHDAYCHLFSYETKYTDTYGAHEVESWYDMIRYYQTQSDFDDYELTVDEAFKSRMDR